jgi:hypothetical protein
MTAAWAPLQPRHGKDYSMFMMFGYVHGGYLVMRTTLSPDVLDDVGRLHASSCSTSRRGRKWTTSTRRMYESIQGPKRVAAEAVARPLTVQPSMHSTEDPSSKRPVARV